MKRARGTGGKGGGSSLLTGLLIGLLGGVAAAVVLAFYLNRGSNPFTSPRSPPPDAISSAPAAQGKGPEVLRPGSGKDPGEGTDFDFYKVLPELSENTDAKTPAQAQPTPAPAEASPPAKVEAPKGTYLQIGAFQNEQDADNLKAKLALVGVEASIFTADIPGKGVWHRVRVGPFNNLGDLERTRDLLKNSGVESTAVRGN
ncbi:SPOR domain-containing protein [Chitiniphilus purpureus]|uniref:SPOR domain-containing protein n=1 Tax=Chitiniphilus purpureus TaxID=2981137 RepID=A0ABY6DV41_9NEIS|nr:SPOR domain-containing protein [Chitiniphilus sp. CD1]UXY15733.1 SPOR domain-containing protein [Chitiniphilus sp. CD1]